MGHDVGSKTIMCHLYHPRKEFTVEVDATASGISSLVAQLSRHNITPAKVRCVMEHCGFYSQVWAKLLMDNNFKVSKVKTTALRSVKGEHGRKDDKIDAKYLGEYGKRYHDKLTEYQPLPEVQQRLAQLYNVYKLEKKASTSKKQLKKVTTDAFALDELTQGISEHENRCKRVIKQVKQLIREHPLLKKKNALLQSIPGVGEIMAWKFLSRFDAEIELDSRKIASWLGVAPGPNQSGSFIGKTKSSGYGNRDFRRILHLGARSSVTHNAERKAYYERKIAEGKPKQVAINNVVNKMLRVITQVWNSEQMFDPNYSQKFRSAA